jgi:hypothetical protein
VEGFEDHRDDNGIYTEIYMSDGKNSRKMKFEESKLDVISPDSCFFNPYPFTSKTKLARGARMFIRFPKRQWKRSLCDETAILSSPLRTIYKAYGLKVPWDDFSFPWEVVKGLLEEHYPSIKEAVVLIKNAGAVAIGPLHCVTLSSIGMNPLISSLFGFIGEIDVKKQAMLIHHKLAFQETLDFLHRTNQTQWEIKCLDQK